MTTLFKAITRTVPKPVNENARRDTGIDRTTERYTRASLDGLEVNNIVVSATVSLDGLNINNNAVFFDQAVIDDVKSMMASAATQGISLETLANRIIDMLLKQNRAMDATVRLHSALGTQPGTNTGVEIFRHR